MTWLHHSKAGNRIPLEVIETHETTLANGDSSLVVVPNQQQTNYDPRNLFISIFDEMPMLFFF